MILPKMAHVSQGLHGPPPVSPVLSPIMASHSWKRLHLPPLPRPAGESEATASPLKEEKIKCSTSQKFNLRSHPERGETLTSASKTLELLIHFILLFI